MSRLDSFIARLVAQRDILDDLAARIGDRPGPVVELGLGNGRTYSHLRALFPGRRILVFERQVAAHPLSRPDAADLVLGDIRREGPRHAGLGAVLVHADLETGDPAVAAELATWVPGLMADLLAPGGYAAGCTPLRHPALEPLPLPPGVAPGRYHAARRRA